MLAEILQLQSDLGMTDTELLLVARWVAGDTRLRSVRHMLGADLADLRDELRDRIGQRLIAA